MAARVLQQLPSDAAAAARSAAERLRQGSEEVRAPVAVFCFSREGLEELCVASFALETSQGLRLQYSYVGGAMYTVCRVIQTAFM